MLTMNGFPQCQTYCFCNPPVSKTLLTNPALILCPLTFLVKEVHSDRTSRCLDCFCGTDHHPWSQPIGQARYTKIHNFKCAKEFVLEVQVLMWRFGAMVFDEGKASCTKYMVVGVLYSPVEIWPSKLVVVYRAVAHTERCPGRQLALYEVTGQHFGSQWTRTTSPKYGWKQHHFQEEAVYTPQNSYCHFWN